MAAWEQNGLTACLHCNYNLVVRQPTLEDVSERYSGAAIALHWLTAVLIVTNLLLGLSMVALPMVRPGIAAAARW